MDLNETGGPLPSFPSSESLPSKFHASSSSNVIPNLSHLPKSPVPHLLNSNQPPSESEIAIILDAILDMEASHVSGANEFVRSHKAVLSNVRGLPNEIIQEIFSHFIPSYRYSCGGPRYSDIPWILGHVCHRWRAVAMSLPCLWNRIPTINLTREFEFTSPSYIEFLTRLVELSGNAPNLGVYLYSYQTEISEHSVIDLLVQNSERIEHLILWSEYTTISAFRGIKGRIPHLRVLGLAPLPSPLIPNIDFFEVAPALQEVRLLGGNLRGENLKLPRLPLVFYREDVADEQCTLLRQVLLSSTDSLTSLKIGRFKQSLGPYIPSITLNRLVNLGLNLDASTQYLLDNITVPAIKNLQISRPRDLPCVTSLLSRSGIPSSLRTLTITGAWPLPGELKSLLQLTPQLRFLKAEFASIEDFTMFIISTESPPLLPRLNTLSICCRNIDGLASAINSLAHSRCELIREDRDSNLGISSTYDTRYPKRLQIFFLPGSVRHPQEILNHWTTVPSSTVEYQVLMRLYIVFRRRLDHDGNPLSTLDKLDQQTDQALSSIENYEVQEIKSLIISQVPDFLWHLIHNPPMRATTLDRRYLFRERIQKILTKWETRLTEWLPTYRWAKISHRGIYVYIPSDDPLRTSSDAMSIVYGVKRDECLPENVPLDSRYDYPDCLN